MLLTVTTRCWTVSPPSVRSIITCKTISLFALYAIPDSVNSEAALAQASDLLRCAGACANGAGNGLSGPARDWVLSVMHLVELAKGYVDKSLDTLATH